LGMLQFVAYGSRKARKGRETSHRTLCKSSLLTHPVLCGGSALIFGESPRPRAWKMASAEDDQFDETDIRFQEAFGARVFRQGKPRALLEVRSPDIPTAIYEARLRGYDRAHAAKARKGDG
jgi:hypothetical protein